MTSVIRSPAMGKIVVLFQIAKPTSRYTLHDFVHDRHYNAVGALIFYSNIISFLSKRNIIVYNCFAMNHSHNGHYSLNQSLTLSSSDEGYQSKSR